MRFLVGLLVFAVGVSFTRRAIDVTGLGWPYYLLIVVIVACAAPFAVRSWERRHPDRCAYCHGHGAKTFIAEKRLRTRVCFSCEGTGLRQPET
jgi:hypothetical protein